MSEITVPNLVESIYKYHKRNIKLYPCHTNRASAIGGPCVRQLVYKRIAWDKAERGTIERQLVFDEGHHHEKRVMLDLMEMGVEIIEQQVAGKDEQTGITYHLDAIVLCDGEKYPLEIKSCAPHIFQALERYDSETGYQIAMEEIGRFYPWLKKYPAQTMIYCFGKALEKGIIIFKNKSNGRLKQFTIHLDLDYLSEIFEKAKVVNGYVEKIEAIKGFKADLEDPEKADKMLPKRISDTDECKYCDHSHLCLPNIDFGAPLKIEDDPGFENDLDNLHLFEQAAKHYNKLHDKIKAQCKNIANKIVGKYHITGKENKKGAWLKKIEIIDETAKKDLAEQSKDIVITLRKKEKIHGKAA